MSKSDPEFETSKRSLFDLLTNFYFFIIDSEFLLQKKDFPREYTSVGKAISSSIFCESVKIGALVETEKIAFEY